MECDMGLFDFFRSRSSSLRGRNSSAKSATAAPADVPPVSAHTAPPAAPTKAAAHSVPLPPVSAPAALDSMATTVSAASSSPNNNNDGDSDDDDDMLGDESKAPAAAPASLGSIQNYEIVKELGRGATAVVQLGKQKDGEQLVALKVFKTSLLKKMREVKRVGRRMVVSTALDKVQVEIAIMKKLQHPHLLNLLEVFDDDSETLVLMLEYAPHGQVMHWDPAARVYTPAATSATALAGKRVFDEDELRKCARQLLLGLEYLHENNICHRDLKPENILIGADGVYKIADFGVAHLFEETTPSDAPADAPGATKKGYVSSTAGTYAFMAPETLKGGAYDAFAADVWALGITVYALALGTIPFYDPDVVTLFEQIEHTPIALPISDSNNTNSDMGVSRDLAAFLLGLLAKEPEKRWSLKQCKQHTWVLDGLDDAAARAFLDTCNEAVTVNSDDVANAVTKVSSFNVLLRVKLGANRWLRKAQKSSDERKRASLTSSDFALSSHGSSSMSSADETSALEQKAPAPPSNPEQLADNQAEI